MITLYIEIRQNKICLYFVSSQWNNDKKLLLNIKNSQNKNKIIKKITAVTPWPGTGVWDKEPNIKVGSKTPKIDADTNGKLFCFKTVSRGCPIL